MTHTPKASSFHVDPDQSCHAPASVLLAYASSPPQPCPIRDVLEQLGHTVNGPVNADDRIIENAQRDKPHVAVFRFERVDDSAAGVVRRLWTECWLPSVAICDMKDLTAAARLIDAGAFAVTTELLEPQLIGASVFAARRRAEQIREMANRISQLERNLANRRLVEQAKWRLVRDRGMTEPDAHRWLQTAARDRRVRIEQIAREIAQDSNEM